MEKLSVKFITLVASAFIPVLFNTAQLIAQPSAAGDISPQKYEVLSELNQKAPMRDGIELTVDIFRPAGDEKFPAIVYLTPITKPEILRELSYSLPADMS